MNINLLHNNERVDVVIVGAGPSGLTLATTLLQVGVSCCLLDRLEQGQNTSRAAVIHAHTLEVLDAIGASERLVAHGMRLTRFTLRDRDRALVRLDFSSLPARYPHLLMLPQNETERVLAERLAAVGGRVERGWNVRSVEESADGVRVIADCGAVSRTLRSRYVVGADGMHSVVRAAAGIGFSGATYEDAFVLADVDLAWPHGRDDVKLFFSPSGLVVVAPLPGGAFRIVATMDEAPELPSVADVQALLDVRGPTIGRAIVDRVHWGSRFRVHHRVADAYRRGRLLLVGDAAHVHSPAGGQGMNAGLVDAWVLGRILAEVAAGRREAGFLDMYQSLRRPAAESVLSLAGRLTGMAVLKGAPQRALRNLALSVLGALPPFRRRLALALSGIARRDAATIPGIGLAVGMDDVARRAPGATPREHGIGRLA